MLERYERRRYDAPFAMYKMIEWWGVFDALASYGHLVSNLIIVVIATNFATTFFMAFNLCCVCIFYAVATVKLSRRAHYSYL